MSSGKADRRERGVLGDWNDDRGFGFITPVSGESRVFAHISAFPRGKRPTVGCAVTYAEVRDGRNRARASDVRYVSGPRARRTAVAGVPMAAAIAVAFFALLGGLLLVGRVPGLLLAAYGLFSALAFLMYGADKRAALRGNWRTSESTLHTVALLGGWPGALVARQVFRHKTTKQPFLTIFWVTVVTNCLALGGFVYLS